MMAYKYPCKDCTKRHTACHDTCEEYLAVKAKNQACEDEYRKNMEARDYTISQVRRNTDYIARNRKKGRFTYSKGE